LQLELAGLRARRSNIDESQVAIRRACAPRSSWMKPICHFAGELIQVRPEEKAWEGAAERLLHNFGLSLLVPDRHYAAVAEWVDRTQLKAGWSTTECEQVRPRGAEYESGFADPQAHHQAGFAFLWLD
jgi:uncharacterized protein YPO0396